MTNEQIPWRWVGIWAAVGAVASAVITAVEGRPAGNIQDGLFVALVVGWSCAPYFATYICCRLVMPTPWARRAVYGVVAYSIIDLASRCQALHAPAESTDALLFLPVWSPIVIATVTATAMAVSWAAATAGRGPAVR